MRITVLAVGRIKAPYVDDVAHYVKLVGRYCRLELVELREDEDVGRRVERLAAAGPASPGAYVALLDMGGRQRTSEAFAAFLEQRRGSGRDLVLVIGGAFGTGLSRVDERISFGALTLPYGLARVVLLEQLFRGHKILAGEPYHH